MQEIVRSSLRVVSRLRKEENELKEDILQFFNILFVKIFQVNMAKYV